LAWIGRWKIVVAVLAAALLVAPAVQADIIIYSDTFDGRTDLDGNYNNNGLGGSVSALWKENGAKIYDVGNYQGKVAAKLNGHVNDAWIDHDFASNLTPYLSKPFRISFKLYLENSSTNNQWGGIRIGCSGTSEGPFGFYSAQNDMARTDGGITPAHTVLGFVFRSDGSGDGGSDPNKGPLATWAWNTGNGGGISIDAIPLGEWVDVGIEIATTGFSNGTNATVKLYLNGVQFTNLRNLGLSEFTFPWKTGTMYIGFENSYTGGAGSSSPYGRYIDDFVISVIPEPATLVFVASGGLTLAVGLMLRRRKRE
jgi:hypothetical protein